MMCLGKFFIVFTFLDSLSLNIWVYIFHPVWEKDWPLFKYFSCPFWESSYIYFRLPDITPYQSSVNFFSLFPTLCWMKLKWLPAMCKLWLLFSFEFIVFVPGSYSLTGLVECHLAQASLVFSQRFKRMCIQISGGFYPTLTPTGSFFLVFCSTNSLHLGLPELLFLSPNFSETAVLCLGFCSLNHGLDVTLGRAALIFVLISVITVLSCLLYSVSK